MTGAREGGWQAAKIPIKPGPYRISRYRLFISHSYDRADEYERLVRMLDRAARRDPTWRWENLSIPLARPIMTAAQAHRGEVYIRRIRKRLDAVHAVLYLLGDEWMDDSESIFLELVEARPRFRPYVPLISVLPRATELETLTYGSPGVATVGWYAPAIIRAVREHAVPAIFEELPLTAAELAERRRLVRALEAAGGRMAETARALGMSTITLQRKRIAYLIR